MTSGEKLEIIQMHGCAIVPFQINNVPLALPYILRMVQILKSHLENLNVQEAFKHRGWRTQGTRLNTIFAINVGTINDELKQFLTIHS